ncbi:hypothetical protein M3Y99_01107400 [Aphelenchoides fujianensis]|nr:hypothetical protein M3Y99_01107400 [Aphelenchoides fujianensis]
MFFAYLNPDISKAVEQLCIMSGLLVGRLVFAERRSFRCRDFSAVFFQLGFSSAPAPSIMRCPICPPTGPGSWHHARNNFRAHLYAKH